MRPHWALVSLGAASAALALSVHADEMSGSDKLRLLYSHRFSFTREGLPLVTVEIMSGQQKVALSAENGVRVLPQGDGGPEVVAGPSWTITVENPRPAKLRHWIIVGHDADDATLATWKQRGYEPKTFETGVVFGVEGEMIDSRATLLGIAPENDAAAAARSATALAARWKVETSVFPEMVEPPHGTVVARDASNGKSGTVVRNDGVLWFSPATTSGTLTVADVVHGGGGSQIGAEKRETRSYFGRVYVTVGQDGLLTVVNAIPEDRLLMGLVPSEMFPDAPAEALRAQAVAARTELLAKIGTRHFNDPYVICSSQHCQVYGGVGLEDERTSKAVRGTRGEVLMRDGGGGLVQAYYSASCGGFGEHNENIWATPPDPSLRGHLDATGKDAQALARFAGGVTDANVRDFLDAPAERSFCGRSRYAKGRFRWRVELDAAKLDALVAAEFPAVGSVRKLTPRTRGISGRVRSLEIVGAKTTVSLDGDLRIRRLFGGLKSTLFVVTSEKQSGQSSHAMTWTFDGAGFGHGVGMCQTGAIGMAEAGQDYRTILRHYYGGSHVHSLY
jgi:stage II sporulation protein D